MKKTSFLLILSIFSCIYARAQDQVLKGQVVDSKTKSPLAFVSIAVKNTYVGTTTDINGKFSLTLPGKGCEIIVSYVGYEKAVYGCDSIARQDQLIIPLVEKTTELNEVVITSGENPAHRIIQLATQNKAQHDPYKLSSFRYNSYNKIFFTLKTPEADTLILDEKDSSTVNNHLKDRHLFVSESYTERKYLASGHSKEIVLANKMTGYRNPAMAMVATDFQPLSFYEDLLHFFDRQYLNPVSRGSTKKYSFVLEETLLHKHDTTFIISFEPGAGKNFEGLKGLISINSNGYAIENVIAEPVERHLMVWFRIQQKYDRLEANWFPVQLQTDVEFTNYKIAERNLIISSRSSLSNIQIAPELDHKEFDHLSTEMSPGANKQDARAWQLYRADSLDVKERNTYGFYDSLGLKKKAFLHGYMNIMEGLLAKRIKTGPFDIMTNHLYSYNEHEGNRFGIGMQTNEDLSRFFRLGGYIGYGFKDKGLKYGGNLAFMLHRKTETALNFSYRKDVAEPGSIDFFREIALHTPTNINGWITSRMDHVERLKSSLSFRTLKYLQVQASLKQEARNPAYEYQYTSQAELTFPGKASLQVLEAGIGLRYASKERYTQIGRGKMVLSTAYPVFTFYYGRGLENAGLQGNFTYNRLAFKIDHVVHTKGLGSTNLHLNTGISSGDIPYPYLNSGQGSLSSSLGTSFYIANHFQTMHMYEFLSDRYAYLFLTHNLGRLLYQSRYKYFQPELTIVQNIGFGSLSKPEQHQDIYFKTMEKGYYESGLLINNLLRVSYINMAYLGLGVGAFYNYGPNSAINSRDNLSLKATLNLSF